jgi:ubiquinone/menaquinone biosynthesis C-methylase UbiE
MSDELPAAPAPVDRARSFGPVAEAYDRGRPSYPAEAVAWLAGGEAKVVLELAAGTGKLTRELVDQGHAVFATEPDEAMLEVLRERVPEVSAKVATAEEIPANDRSVDVVVVAQAFHWFDHDAALAEIARVLKPGGHVALVWNSRDERIPWVRRMGDILGRQDSNTGSSQHLVHSDLFGFVEETTFKHWQEVNRETVLDLARSRSSFAAMDDDERERHLAELLAFYDDYGRGMDGMQIPYVTRCYRAVVVDRTESDPSGPTTSSPDEPSQEGPVVSDGTDTDMLLIDFR